MKRLYQICLVLVVVQELVLWALLDGHPRHALGFVTPWLLTSALLATTLASWLLLLFGRRSLALIGTAAVVAVLTGVHYFKAQFLGTPLFFWDYVLLEEGLRSVEYLVTNPWLYAGVALGAGLLGFAAWMIARRDKRRYPLKFRLAAAAGTLALSVSVFLVAQVPYSSLFPANSFRDSKVVHTGLLSFLALSARYSGAASAPPGYDQAEVRRIAAKYAEDDASDKPSPPLAERPNIIFYVMESLMDYSALGIRYKQDPMPFFNSLRATSGDSIFLSPTYGGKTVQPEFELLTGLSQFALMSPNPMAYVNRDRHPFPSLCDVMHSVKYACFGLNAVTADNFQRDLAYKRMQFDEFDGLETLFSPSKLQKTRGRVADEFLVDTFLTRRPQDRPVFAYLMTNSTHAQYGNWELRPEFEVVSDGLSADSRDALSRYASAVHQADQALAKLVDGLKSSGRPTIVIAYGDHLPGLTSVFDDLDLTGRPLWEQYEKHKTPLRIWTSDGRPVKKDAMISPNLMIGLLADFLGSDAKLPLQFRIAKKLYESYDVVSQVLVDKQRSTVTREIGGPAENEPLSDYEMIEYDLLQGKRFAAASQIEASL